MEILMMTILVGISLSMDTFSVSLAYGTLNIKLKKILIISLIVGIYHFFMPLIGLYLGHFILDFIKINPKYIIILVFTFIGLEMIFNHESYDNSSSILNIFGVLLFGFTVSIDSFSTGIGLNIINRNYLQASIIFMFVSFLFTYLGLKLGTILSTKYGKYATILGGIILILLAVYYYFTI